jgi:hypothetical protein
MATADNPFVPIPKTDIDDHAGHLHEVRVVNIEDDDRETLEYEPQEDDLGEPAIESVAKRDDKIYRQRHAEAEARR